MRRSCGSNGDMGRTVGRILSGGGGVRASQRTTTKNNKPNTIPSLTATNLSICDSQLSLVANPWGSSSWNSATSPRFDTDWEHVGEEEEVEEELGGVSAGLHVGLDFEPIPSSHEVDGALTSLQQFFAPTCNTHFFVDGSSSSSDKDGIIDWSSPPRTVSRVPSTGSEMDWFEPSMQRYDPKTMLSGAARVYDALHLLETEPFIKRVVKSISTDTAVWDAVMNNEAVKELRDCYTVEKGKSSAESPVVATSVLSWILDTSKSKVMELMDRIGKLFSDVFTSSHPEKVETTTGDKQMFEERLRSSVLLSVIVLLMVVVTRATSV